MTPLTNCSCPAGRVGGRPASSCSQSQSHSGCISYESAAEWHHWHAQSALRARALDAELCIHCSLLWSTDDRIPEAFLCSSASSSYPRLVYIWLMACRYYYLLYILLLINIKYNYTLSCHRTKVCRGRLGCSMLPVWNKGGANPPPPPFPSPSFSEAPKPQSALLPSESLPFNLHIPWPDS